MISSLNLDYKKWRLDNQEALTDFVSAGIKLKITGRQFLNINKFSSNKGLTSENRFDQLFAACMIGGPNEKFESVPPISNRYLTCGNSPYIGFYYAIEV